VVYGAQTADVAYGRSSANADLFAPMEPTPAAPNR
jgi:hypothetical protein